MKRYLFAILALISGYVSGQNNSLLVEVESSANKGGWLVDPQFVEQMGSAYLLAHGMGIPVKDASTEIKIQKSGVYHVWARTKNWSPGKWASLLVKSAHGKIQQ